MRTVTFTNDGFDDAVGSFLRSLLGGIAINKEGWEDYLEDSRTIGIQFDRFPGGTLAEIGVTHNDNVRFAEASETFVLNGPNRTNFAYDLRNPELIAPDLLLQDQNSIANEYATLSDVFARAVQNNTPVGVILPVFRYFQTYDFAEIAGRQAGLREASADVGIFLQRLKSGHFNDGDLPRTIYLEIGNEAYSNPIEYALIARQMIREINTRMSDSSIDIKIAVQMNIGSNQLVQLDRSGYFDRFFDQSGRSSIPELRDIHFTGAEDMRYQDRITFLDEIILAILRPNLADIDMLRHHYLDVTIDRLNYPATLIDQRSQILETWLNGIEDAGGNSNAVLHYVSAWTTSSANFNNAPYGMAAAVNAMELMAHFVRSGVDIAAVWGIGGTSGYFPNQPIQTVITNHRTDEIAPAGRLLRLMADELPGLVLHDDDVPNVLTGRSETDFIVNKYVSDARTVFHFAVGNIADSGLRIRFDVTDLEKFRFAEVSRIQTLDGSGMGHSVVRTQVQTIQNGHLALLFSEDYQVIQVVFEYGIMSAIDPRIGSAGHNRMLGSSRSDILDGVGGHDTIFGRSGNDLVYGGVGNDMVWGGHGDDRLHGMSGADAVFGGSGSDRVWGNIGNDRLLGADGDDTLFGEQGNDFISAGSGVDRIYGGEGSDRLLGGLGDDIILGGNDRDYLHGESGRDRLYGEVGDDRISGGISHDSLYGGVGNDVLSGGEDRDLVYGGMGRDHLFGGNEDDRLFGGSGSDVLRGGLGRDTLLGEDSDDRIFGEAESDIAYGGAGDDWISGGSGNDLIDGGSGRDFLGGDLGDDRLFGCGEADSLHGSFGRDVLFGGDGADQVFGGSGSDLLLGDGADDFLFGGGGTDQLFGGEGSDRLNGGLGSDTYIGGSGHDVFVFESGHDTVADFRTGQDRIVVDAAPWSIRAALEVAEVRSGNLVIDFGGGNSITLRNVVDRPLWGVDVFEV